MKPFTSKIGFLSAFIIPLLVAAGYYAGGYWNFLTIIFSFLLIPLLDQAIGPDDSNVPPDRAASVAADRYYRFITLCWTWFQMGFMVWGAMAVASGKIGSPVAVAAFVASFSLAAGGIGITVAHELGHKRSSFERFCSKALLMTVSYMHFYVEHNRGHHVHVATPEDPATARAGENFYSFWIRSVFGGYLHAWKLENARLRRKGKPLVSIHNSMIWFTILPLVFGALLTGITSLWYGRLTWEVPLFFIAQSVLAFTFLELVNYIEHYGILRRQLPDGQFERVNPLHSWNSSHLISNFFLFQLQRHSDHHAHALKPYQVLDHCDESPQLPFGYPTMILIALVPPLWFSMMDRRLEEWQRSANLVAA